VTSSPPQSTLVFRQLRRLASGYGRLKRCYAERMGEAATTESVRSRELMAQSGTFAGRALLAAPTGRVREQRSIIEED